MPARPALAPPSSAAARRDQVLAAAADCFRAQGFHGTSMAQISKAAGMSVGHIYHYFANKEAIIAAIVAQDLERLLTLNLELRSAADVLDAFIARIDEGIAANLDPANAALRLEIVAEAARNPGIAGIVRAADARLRESLAQTVRSARRAAGHKDGKRAIDAMVETIAALFGGLLIRAARNPGLDRKALTLQFRGAIRALLTQPPV